MTARPMLTEFVARLARVGGPDIILDRIAGGDTVAQVYRGPKDGDSLETIVGMKFSQGFLYTYLYGDRIRPRYDKAKKVGAEAMAEDGATILDDLADKGFPTGPMVSLATARAAHRLGLAKMRDPERFGDKTASVIVNVQSLHLDALRQSGAAPPTIEAELIPEPLALPEELADL